MNCNVGLQNNKYILTQSDWERMYSKAVYKNKTEHVREHTLHYLLAFNQSDNTILPYIEKIKNNVSILTLADKTNFHLTPLLIATMKGRIKVVQVLFETCKKDGKSLSQEADFFGWTVLHHAKISSEEIYRFLLSHGANPRATNLMGGTPEDIGSLVEYELKPISIQRTFYQSKSGKRMPISEIGKEKMKKLLGLEEYRDNPYYLQNGLKELWQLSWKGQMVPVEIGMYQVYLNSPPLLTIQPCKELWGKVKNYLELCAGQDLQFGTIICQYSGTVITDDKYYYQSFLRQFDPDFIDAIEYRYKNIDAKKIGNASRYANWGWPNVIIVEIKDKGTTRQVLMVSDPQGIKKGEPIHLIYGITYTHLAFGAQKLLGRDKMRQYFAKADLKTHLTRFQQITQKSTLKTFQNAMHLQMYLEFPLETPGALLDLHFSEIITAAEWIEEWMINQNDYILTWAQSNPMLCFRVQSMMFRLLELETKLSEHPQLKKKFSEWVLSKIGNLSVMQILKAMDLVVPYTSFAFSEEFWAQVKNSLEQTIHYDWTKDEDASIGTKKMINDLVLLYSSLLQKGGRPHVLRELSQGLKIWLQYPNKEKYENYQILLEIVERLGLKEDLSEFKDLNVNAQ